MTGVLHCLLSLVSLGFFTYSAGSLPTVLAVGEALGPGILSVTVLDDRSGLEIPCTVQIVDSQGRVFENSPSFRGGFRSSGSFEIELPSGPTRVRISRGFESIAVEDQFELGEKERRTAVYRLRRRVDMRSRGWYGGDSHAHMIHGERLIPVDFETVALAARAEDLQYLSLAYDWIIPNATPEELEEALERVSTPDCRLTWNMEVPKNYLRGDARRCLGHGWSLNVRGRTQLGSNVIPLLLEASAHDYEVEKPVYANFESHGLIRAQGGFSFYTHPFRWWWGPWGGQAGYPFAEKTRVSNMAVELPLDTLLGPTYDGIDLLTTAGEEESNQKAFHLWRMLLNRGYRVAATASSDSTFDRPGGGRPGSVRTYTYLNEPFSLGAVARATALGRTFVTSGPLIVASLEGFPPGSSTAADGTNRKLRIEAWASGSDSVGLSELELYRNGEVIERRRFDPPVFDLEVSREVTETESAWYCIRVRGGEQGLQQAITGAFFLDPSEFHPPEPVPVRVAVNISDRETGQPLEGTAHEIRFLGPVSRKEGSHLVPKQGALLEIPGTVRLQVEVEGYQPLTLSPILDSPQLLERIADLTPEQLEEWRIFEEIRTLLGELRLEFSLHR